LKTEIAEMAGLVERIPVTDFLVDGMFDPNSIFNAIVLQSKTTVDIYM